MQKQWVIFASFIIMLCLGSIYAWSIFVPELKDSYGLLTAQTQLVFGTVIAVFPITMIWAARASKKYGPRLVATISGICVFLGYAGAYFSQGNFIVILLTIGVLGGIGTGAGYLVALSMPVKWYPERKGLVTGIVVAGFGAGAVILTYLAEFLLLKGVDVLRVFLYTGILYGLVITIMAQFIHEPDNASDKILKNTFKLKGGVWFYQLAVGIFAGTFTGLLVVGNLKPIALVQNISTTTIPLAISVFALANFAGRVTWGALSDKFHLWILIPLALIIQGLASLAMVYLPVSNGLFVAIVFVTGFCFGGNFVLFARDTIRKFGLQQYDRAYPLIFLGYAFAGIVGPLIGGSIYDITGSYLSAVLVALGLSLLAIMLYLVIEKNNSQNIMHE